MAKIDTYKAILKAAQEAGLVEQIPEDEEELKSEAEFFLKEAEEAFKNGNKDSVVREIVNLGMKLGQTAVAPIFGDEHEVYKGLPVPPNPRTEPTPIPLDFTEIGDLQLRKLHGEYGAYLSSAKWKHAVASNRYAEVVHLRDAAYRDAYRKAAETMEGKPTRDFLDTVARQDKKYLEFDNAARLHNEEVTSYKALMEIYGGYVDRLSRDFTMRQEDGRRH